MEYHDGYLSRAQLGARERASTVARGGSGCGQQHPLAPVRRGPSCLAVSDPPTLRLPEHP